MQLETDIKQTRAEIIQKMGQELTRVDTHLPVWARRSNPIVRRHLGVYVKTVPPQVDQLLLLYAIQSALLFSSAFIPFVFNIALPLITAAIMLLPIGFVTYGQLILSLVNDSATTMLRELQNDTLTVLRSTPLTLWHIVLGKVSAALWRRVEDLNLVLLVATLFGLPVIILEMAHLWPPDKYPYLSQIGIIIIFGASLLRLLFEPFMIASIGVMIGAAVPYRSSAITSTMLVTAFYYLLINLPRLLPLSFTMRIVIEAVLPLIMPVIITWGALHLSVHLLSRD